jgi:hypothetical protein
MISTFGPNGHRVLALIASIPGLSAGQIDQVISAWKRDCPRARARAWAQLNRITTEGERYRILAAAALARREALDTARQAHRMDWAFWAAPTTPARPWPPAPASAATTTRCSHRSRQPCPHSAAPEPQTAPQPPPTPRPAGSIAPNGEHGLHSLGGVVGQLHSQAPACIAGQDGRFPRCRRLSSSVGLVMAPRCSHATAPAAITRGDS